MKDLIALGEIVKPHGVKGELKVLTDFVEQDFNSKPKFVFIDNVKHDVQGMKFAKDCILLKLSGINTMTDAENFRNKEVLFSHSCLQELDEDEFYSDDLIGCEVFLENEKLVGKLVEVQNYGASDIFLIKNGTEELLCPVVKGLIKDVDFDNAKIVLDEAKYLEVTQYAD